MAADADLPIPAASSSAPVFAEVRPLPRFADSSLRICALILVSWLSILDRPNGGSILPMLDVLLLMLLSRLSTFSSCEIPLTLVVSLIVDSGICSTSCQLCLILCYLVIYL